MAHSIEYQDHAAASDAGRDYKSQLLHRMELTPGLHVLDVGCGPGTDLPSIADRVGVDGLVIGVDNDPAMVAEAQRRLGADGRIEIRTANAHTLPFADDSVDRARTDRVLQHVADPAKVLAELHRVVRPGGLITLAEPDWDTLVIDDSDVQASRCYSSFVATQVVRNGSIGRQLARLSDQAGFTVDTLDVKPIVFRDYVAAERILSMPSVAQRAVQAHALSQRVASQWLERLTTGPFLATFNLFIVTARDTTTRSPR